MITSVISITPQTFFCFVKPLAVTTRPLMATVNTGSGPDGIGTPSVRQHDKHRGPTILQKQKKTFLIDF